MLFRRNRPAANPVPRPVAAPVPQPIQPICDVDDEYVAEAKKLGRLGGAIADAGLRRALSRLGVKEYDYASVAAYLDGTVKNLGNDWRWHWRPVRAEDMEKVSRHLSGWDSGRILRDEPYQHPIPLHILRMMNHLKDEIPEIHLYISEIAQRPKGDPFLAVSKRDTELMVVAQWDEPSFRGRDPGFVLGGDKPTPREVLGR